MTRRPSVSIVLALLSSAALSTQCGGSPSITSPSVVNPVASSSTNPVPSPPANASPSVVSVKVGVLGNATASIAPGDSLQLWALATYSDDRTVDVTNTAEWQSSDPALATISRDGLLKAGGLEGTVEAKAAVDRIAGSVRADIRRRGCQATLLSPGDVVFSAFSNSQYVLVVTPSSDCRWTASSNSDWLRFSGSDRVRYDPGKSGSGNYTFSVLANNSLEPRSGSIALSFTDGTRVVQSVKQEGSAVCSYAVSPDEKSFPTAGGVGAFGVIATPSTCRWTATSSYGDSYVKITAGTSGTGPGNVNYVVNPYPYSCTGCGTAEFTITVSGLSGISPSAVYRIHQSR